MKRSVFIILILFFSLPTVSYGAIRINEIAWMGTSVGPNEEWIELYNDGQDSVDVSGWVLSDDVGLSITLAGTIGAGEYAVLERTDDATISGTAFQIYTGALANDGRTLTLRREDATKEDEVIGGTDWENIGGNNDTKETAQRTTSGWVTGIPTPGAQNILFGTPQEKSTTTNENYTTSKTKSGGGSSGSVKKRIVEPTIRTQESVLTLKIEAPRIAYVNQEVSFRLVASGAGTTILNSLNYVWNFGDTYTSIQKEPLHSFAYPGEYVVMVDAMYVKQKASARYEIMVLPVTLSLSRTESNDISIHNTASNEINIGEYQLQGVTTLTFPKNTFIKPNSTLTISSSRVNATTHTPLSLYDTSKTLVATTEETLFTKTMIPSQPLLYSDTRTARPIINASSEVTQSISHDVVSNNIVPKDEDMAVIVIGATSTTQENDGSWFTHTRIMMIFSVVLILGILTLYVRRDGM